MYVCIHVDSRVCARPSFEEAPAEGLAAGATHGAHAPLAEY